MKGLLLGFCLVHFSDAFTVLPQNHRPVSPSWRSQPRSYVGRLFALPDIQDMRIKEMRSELESYGISTRTFLEKTEFVDALKKARDEGLTPKSSGTDTATKDSKDASASASAGNEYADAYSYYNGETDTNNGAKTKTKKNGTKQTKSTKNGTKESGPSRAERLQEETEKAKSMRVSELKQKLSDLGVNTKSFFEKTEFVRAYAEAVVDGVNGGAKAKEEDYDPEYRDVVMQKFDPQSQQRYLLGGNIIDIEL